MEVELISTIDLIVLGFLLHRPMNAYELVRYIRDQQVARILKISEPAVFKSCKRLFKQGLLSGEIIREPGLPDKMIYSVKNAGKEHFHKLMEHYSSKFNPFYLDANAFFWHLGRLEQSEARRMLGNLQRELHGFRAWIIEHEKEVPKSHDFAQRMLVKQYRMMFITLSDWIDEVIEEYAVLNV